MKNKQVNSQLQTESRFRSWLVPHKISLLIVWLVTTITMIVMLMNGVGGTSRYNAVRHTLHVLYLMALFWHLARTGPKFDQLPRLNPPVLLRWKFGAWLPVLGIALLFALNLFSDDGWDLLILLSAVASVVVLVVWLSDIRLGLVIQGITVATFAYLTGLQFVKIGVLSESWNTILSAFTLPFYIAGGLLFKRTGLGGMQLLNGKYREVLKSVFFGCLLFVPLGLFNAFGGSSVDTSSVRQWWIPFWLPWWSGLNEETWFRLYLVGLIYFLMRPAFRKFPNLVVIAAVLFSGITFGVGHDRTLEGFLTTGLLYGVPFAAVFAKRDWEHAVGAHYMVNLIPTVVTFLQR